MDASRGASDGRGRARYWLRAVGSVGARPDLWSTAVRQYVRATPRRWWRRVPFLPVPDRAYVRFRMETAYGARGTPRVEDLVTYLEWCRDTERIRRAERRRSA